MRTNIYFKKRIVLLKRGFLTNRVFGLLSVLIKDTGGNEVKRGYNAMRETSLRDRSYKITITYTNNRHSRKGDNSTVLNK